MSSHHDKPRSGRRPLAPEEKPHLVRMAVRVEPSLQGILTDISERLFRETRIEYSYNAILRGLIQQGVMKVTEIPPSDSIVHLFEGARVPRGRRQGESPRSEGESEEEDDGETKS